MPKGKAPAFQFYVRDWLSDPQLVMASKATKGIWIDCLCYMWESAERGKLTGTPLQLGRLLGCNNEEIEQFLNEIHDLGFADLETDPSITFPLHVTDCNRKVTICNRRMWRDNNRNENNRLRVRRHREKRKSNAGITPPSSTSSSTALHSLSKDKQPPVASSNHFETKVGAHFKSIKSLCDSITSKPNKNGKPFNPFEWVQQKSNKRGHPEAIEKCLSRIDREWEHILTPWGYVEKLYGIENQNANEREAITIHQKMKELKPEALKKLTSGMLESI